MKTEKQAEQLAGEVRQLKLIITQLEKRIAEARPHMEAIERHRRTNETQVIDYVYENK